MDRRRFVGLLSSLGMTYGALPADKKVLAWDSVPDNAYSYLPHLNAHLPFHFGIPRSRGMGHYCPGWRQVEYNPGWRCCVIERNW